MLGQAIALSEDFTSATLNHQKWPRAIVWRNFCSVIWRSEDYLVPVTRLCLVSATHLDRGLKHFLQEVFQKKKEKEQEVFFLQGFQHGLSFAVSRICNRVSTSVAGVGYP
jgi:hypothetical protein